MNMFICRRNGFTNFFCFREDRVSCSQRLRGHTNISLDSLHIFKLLLLGKVPFFAFKVFQKCPHSLVRFRVVIVGTSCPRSQRTYRRIHEAVLAYFAVLPMPNKVCSHHILLPHHTRIRTVDTEVPNQALNI